MATGAGCRVLGAAMWPLALLAIVANVLLAFPDWKTEYVHGFGEHLTPEVLYLGGLVGGGVLILIPAIHIQAAGSHRCSGNHCGMLLSVLVGAVGAAYAIVVSMLGLAHGPLCQYLQNGTHLDWGRPFEHSEERLSEEGYLFNRARWDICRDPPGVVQFNVILFSLILGTGLVELGLCLVQIFRGLFGCVCGAGCKEETPQTYS